MRKKDSVADPDVVSETTESGEDDQSEDGCCACLPVGDAPREPFWDNLKGILQFFVVCMHTAMFLNMLSDYDSNYLNEMGKLRQGYASFIFLITMPGYSVISGYFSSQDMNRKRVVQQGRFFLAFLIQHAFMMLLVIPKDHAMEVYLWKKKNPDWNSTDSSAGPEPSIMPIHWFAHAGADWFLFTLVLWRCVLPLFARFSWPLLISVIFAILMMMTDVTKSTYSNAPCVYLPFFVLGYKLKGQAAALKRWRSDMKVRAAFFVAAIALVLARIFTRVFEDAVMNALGCLYGGALRNGIHFNTKKQQLAELGNLTNQMADAGIPPESLYCQSPLGVLNVLGFYVVSSLMIIGFMSSIPEREVWLLTKAGVNSLYIYLIHIWFVIIPGMMICEKILLQHGPAPAAMSLISWLFVSFLAWSCMAGEWVKYCCFYCVEPPYERCLLEVDGENAT